MEPNRDPILVNAWIEGDRFIIDGICEWADDRLKRYLISKALDDIRDELAEYAHKHGIVAHNEPPPSDDSYRSGPQ